MSSFSSGMGVSLRRAEPSTRLTDATDRARLRALALVAAGMLLATTFIWVRHAVVEFSPPPGLPAAAANHATAAHPSAGHADGDKTPAAVAESAAAGVAHAAQKQVRP